MSTSMKGRTYVEAVPSFDEMVVLHEALEDCRKCLTALSEGGDVAQRATDLYFSAQAVMEVVQCLATEEAC